MTRRSKFRGLLVVVELKAVGAAAAGHRAQGLGVALHPGVGHLGLDDGVTALRVHARDAAPLAGHIADDVAGVVLRDDDVQPHDGLAVHRVGATVVDDGFQIRRTYAPRFRRSLIANPIDENRRKPNGF